MKHARRGGADRLFRHRDPSQTMRLSRSRTGEKTKKKGRSDASGLSERHVDLAAGARNSPDLLFNAVALRYTRIPNSGRCRHSLSPVFGPCLEHQNVPKQILVVDVAGQVLRPFLPHHGGIEKSFLREPFSRDQAFGPVAERPPEPAVDRNAKHCG